MTLILQRHCRHPYHHPSLCGVNLIDKLRIIFPPILKPREHQPTQHSNTTQRNNIYLPQPTSTSTSTFTYIHSFRSTPSLPKMKLLTANFVTCAVKACKTTSASFPLHFHDAELEEQELEFQPLFIRNVLARVDWDALKVTAAEVPPPRTICVASRVLMGVARIPRSPGDETGVRDGCGCG